MRHGGLEVHPRTNMMPGGAATKALLGWGWLPWRGCGRGSHPQPASSREASGLDHPYADRVAGPVP